MVKKIYENLIAPVIVDDIITGTIGVAADITERKKLEIEREGLLNELQRSNKELQQFAYIASHDLKELLRTISSFISLLGHRYKVNWIKMLKNTLSSFLMEPIECREFEPVNLNRILDITFNNLKNLIDETNTTITHDTLPVVKGDSRQLIQLFQNLISNAIKYKKPDEYPKIHISCRIDKDKNSYVISVSDSGIDPQFKDRIFTIFQRLHTKEGYEGPK